MKLKSLLLVCLIGVAGTAQHSLSAQTSIYELPNDNAGCPANCRQIPWKAGSDVWNGGTLPTAAGVACTAGLTEGDGTTDNTAAIESCLSAIASGQAAVLPAGMYYVNSSLDIPPGKVLRGAGSTNCAQGRWITSSWHGDTGSGATCTTLKLGPSGYVNMPGNASLGTAYNLSGGYAKGSQSLVAATTPTGIAANDWILISELEDPAIPSTLTGENGTCTWCGEANATGRPMTQVFQVTSVSGNTINISRPLYYTFKSGLAPRVREITGTAMKAGIEQLKLWGSSTARTEAHIDIDGCMLCWVKGVETYDTPDIAKAYPIYIQYSYGNEIRDSYFHFGRGNSGDRNYGIGMFGPNSDHKVENNIYRENRHSWSQEGGGSGNVFLYNYVDDNYTNDTSFLGSPRANHGAHPYMTLFEGNIVSHFASDGIWGSSSHVVLFRNWLWGDATGSYPSFSSTNWGFVALEIDRQQHYYSALANVLGNPNLHTNWSNASVMQANCSFGSSRSAPMVYGLGCVSQSGTYDAAVRSTLILHGNYDYKTQGVANWDGGSARGFNDSMYYSSKPAFFGACAWPAFGPDVPSITNTLPAMARYEGSPACSSGTPTAPAPPRNLRITGV
jgi:hypothetical protein